MAPTGDQRSPRVQPDRSSTDVEKADGMSSTTSSPENPTILPTAAGTGFLRSLMWASVTIVALGAGLALLWH